MRSGTPYSILKPLLGVALCCALVENALGAADMNIDASISPGIFYTDNVCLSDTNKKDNLDWESIGLLTPSGSISSKGSRTSFDLNGSVQFNTLTNSKLKEE